MSKLFSCQLICLLEDQLANGEGTSLDQSTVRLIDALFEVQLGVVGWKSMFIEFGHFCSQKVVILLLPYVIKFPGDGS